MAGILVAAKKTGVQDVRAHFLDVAGTLAQDDIPDPIPEAERHGYGPGSWPGHPVDRLPPECPVRPLGKSGDLTYFEDTLGQLRGVNVNKWGKKILIDLFADCPNYVTWAWPRFGRARSDGSALINGVEVDDGVACMLKAAAKRGLFSPQERLRGRGAWLSPKTGDIVWHSGDALWTIEGGELRARRTGEVDRMFYPRLPTTLTPWQAPVEPKDSPAHHLLGAFRAWKWERPQLDPVLLVGWLGTALLAGALGWRPPCFITGDKGQGKSTLQALVKEVLGSALHASSDTTAAGIYQRVKQDTLPVAVDEIEADADNRKAMGVVKLARLAASGGVMFRGGAEHEGVEFQARNAFLFSSINPPPLGPQDRSRTAILQLRKIDQGGRPPELPGAIDTYGRRLLRQLMDGWAPGHGRPGFAKVLAYWREAMREGGLDGRTQDTYGTLLACANLLLGDEAIEAAGLPITDPGRIGEMIRTQTAEERAEQTDNWRGCLEHMLGSTVEAWKSGEKPTIGGIWDALDRDEVPGDSPHSVPGELGRRQLAAAGLGLYPRERIDGAAVTADWIKAYDLSAQWLLAVPSSSPLLGKLFAGTQWGSGVWTHALKQAPEGVVRRAWKPGVVKINRVAARCLLVDLAAYDHLTGRGDEDE